MSRTFKSLLVCTIAGMGACAPGQSESPDLASQGSAIAFTGANKVRVVNANIYKGAFGEPTAILPNGNKVDGRNFLYYLAKNSQAYIPDIITLQNLKRDDSDDKYRYCSEFKDTLTQYLADNNKTARYAHYSAADPGGSCIIYNTDRFRESARGSRLGDLSGPTCEDHGMSSVGLRLVDKGNGARVSVVSVHMPNWTEDVKDQNGNVIDTKTDRCHGKNTHQIRNWANQKFEGETPDLRIIAGDFNTFESQDTSDMTNVLSNQDYKVGSPSGNPWGYLDWLWHKGAKWGSVSNVTRVEFSDCQGSSYPTPGQRVQYSDHRGGFQDLVYADVLGSRKILTGAPSVIFTSGPADNNQNSTVQFTAELEGQTSYSCSLDGTPLQPCGTGSPPYNITLNGITAGAHTFRINASNASGTEYDEYKWTQLPGLPVVTWISGPQTAEKAWLVHFNTAVSNQPTSVSCWLDSPSNAKPCNVGEFDVGGVYRTTHYFHMLATNAAGTTDNYYSWTGGQCPDNECWRGDLGLYTYNFPTNSNPSDPRLARIIFDRKFYINAYPDVLQWCQNKVATQGGNLYDHAEWHWLNYGIPWGRMGSPTWDPVAYMNWNPDVSAAYGWNNYNGAISHYITYGRFEGRRASVFFDVGNYKARYGDIGWFANWQALDHFANNGMDEGRQGSADFGPAWYLGVNPDVRSSWGNNYYRGGMIHWIANGRNEGRLGTNGL